MDPSKSALLIRLASPLQWAAFKRENFPGDETSAEAGYDYLKAVGALLREGGWSLPPSTSRIISQRRVYGDVADNGDRFCLAYCSCDPTNGSLDVFWFSDDQHSVERLQHECVSWDAAEKK